MDYVIHTFGGGDILWHIFNGIGRVFASDSEYFTPVGKFALTLGGIWAATRAIFKGNIGIFAMEWFFPSFFIFIFLFTPKATIWLKDEVSMNAPVKIDNIPIGIAFFASSASKISYSLSEMLEKHLLPADEGLSNRKNGIMFGAKAIGKIKDIQIEDPITLTNSKEFLRQCFIKPYVIGNILGKKGAAQKTNDIIGFIEQNMPNNFGIYYKDPSNSAISFKNCRQVTPLIKAAINKELHEGLLTKFASSIGVQSDRPEQLNQRLKAMTGDTLKYLKKEQTDIHQWMKQAMLLNANRESYDDWREKFSLARIYPQLVSMNATRGLFQQLFSYLVAGEMAATIMPILQSVFFALVTCMIFIVFPMSMLPGGFNILKTWLLLIIWVASWSVFFTIIHCLGMISLAGKSSSSGLTGLNILSQGSFSEMILHSYATFQMLATCVPMLSWAVLKGCVHATTTLANQFSPISVASGIGANIADNNISMDNYNIGNRTIAQQSLTPTLQMAGGIIDDGGMRVTSTDSGKQMLTESVDSLVNNYRSSKLLQDSYQSQFTNSQSYLDGLTDRYSDLTTTGESLATEIGKRLSYEEAKSIGITDSQYLALQQTNSDSESATEHTSNSNRKGTSTNAEASIGGNVGIGIGVKVGSENRHEQDQGKTVNQQQSYNEALSKIKSATKEGRLNQSNSDVQSLSNNLNSNFSEQQSVGQEIARTKQNMEQLSYNVNYVSQNSASIDRNLNEPVLDSIVAKNIPGVTSKEQAARWASTHQKEAEQIALDIAKINNIVPKALSSNSSSNIPSKQELRLAFDKNTKQLNDQAIIDNRKNDIYDKSVEQVLINNTTEYEGEKVKTLNQLPDKIKDKTQQIQDEFNKVSDSTIVRTAQQVADNLEISQEAIKKRNIKLLGYKNDDEN